jgi:D-serine dehydratase
LSREIAASAEPIGTLNKGLGSMEAPMTPGEIAQLGWNLLREELSLPAAVLYREKLEHNLAWMRSFVNEYGVKLAPHGKTTMAPALFQMQIDAGAWAITVATAHQVRVAYEHGIRRVLMANQLVGRPNIEAVARLLDNEDFEFYCLADSPDLIEHLAPHFDAAGRRLNVLIELGVEGGRAGVRSDEQLSELLASLDRHKDAIALCGVEVYEGVLQEEPAIRAFLRRACKVTERLLAEKRFASRPILTGAGSAWFDVVAEEFTASSVAKDAEIVLRPGCYLTHDAGNYRKAQQRMELTNPVACKLQPGLETALHIWAYVQSIPEPGRAIVGMGRRDAAFDSGLPVPALRYRPGAAGSDSTPAAAPAHWEVTKLMDQHAFLAIAPEDDLRVGDMVAFDICHPCLTFDKWRAIPVLDREYRVVDVVRTYF